MISSTTVPIYHICRSTFLSFIVPKIRIFLSLLVPRINDACVHWPCVTLKEMLMHVHGVAVKCQHKGKLKQTHTLFCSLHFSQKRKKIEGDSIYIRHSLLMLEVCIPFGGAVLQTLVYVFILWHNGFCFNTTLACGLLHILCISTINDCTFISCVCVCGVAAVIPGECC